MVLLAHLLISGTREGRRKEPAVQRSSTREHRQKEDTDRNMTYSGQILNERDARLCSLAARLLITFPFYRPPSAC